MTRWMLVCALVTLPSTGMAEAGDVSSVPESVDLSTVDYALPPADEAAEAPDREATWRLPNASWREEDQGDLRVRVKLRPNRAMGRVSLSF